MQSLYGLSGLKRYKFSAVANINSLGRDISHRLFAKRRWMFAKRRLAATIMPETKGTQPKGYAALWATMSYPALLVVMYTANPDSLHWHHCIGCTCFGWAAWVTIGALGISGILDPWFAITLIAEAGLGIVPMLYLLVDYPRVGSSCRDLVYQARIFSTVPLVIITKQLIRTVVDLLTDKTVSTWWHFPVDLAEILMFFMYGLWTAADLGETFFLVYSATPAALSSLLADHMVFHQRNLRRSNARLMQTAFAAVVRIDGKDGGKIKESSEDFDLIVDGAAAGLTLDSFFTASRDQLRHLCAASLEEGKLMRRLRTTLVSKKRAFQQDVELRVLACTEQEVQDEGGLSLGLSIMGERLPVLDPQTVYPSLLLEQHVEEVGQLRVTGVNTSHADAAANMDSVPEFFVDSFDSISCSGRDEAPNQCHVALRHRSRSSAKSSVSSSSMSRTTVHRETCRPPGDVPTYDFGVGSKPATVDTLSETPYGDPWKPPDGAYLSECSKSLLIDLVSSWNYKGYRCCKWHSAINRLGGMVDDLRSWNSCSDVWPKDAPSWQCESCGGLQFETTSADECFLCGQPADPHLDTEP